jgi:hypothetical protein
MPRTRVCWRRRLCPDAVGRVLFVQGRAGQALLPIVDELRRGWVLAGSCREGRGGISEVLVTTIRIQRVPIDKQ